MQHNNAGNLHSIAKNSEGKVKVDKKAGMKYEKK